MSERMNEQLRVEILAAIEGLKRTFAKLETRSPAAPPKPVLELIPDGNSVTLRLCRFRCSICRQDFIFASAYRPEYCPLCGAHGEQP